MKSSKNTTQALSHFYPVLSAAMVNILTGCSFRQAFTDKYNNTGTIAVTNTLTVTKSSTISAHHFNYETL